jgi:hypothetical protein
MNPALEHRHELLGDGGAGAAAAHGDPDDADGHRRSHDSRRQRIAERPVVGDDDPLLVLRERLERHPDVAHVAKARVQPVDELLAVDERVDDRSARGDPVDRGSCQGERRTVRDPDHVVDRRRPVADVDDRGRDRHGSRGAAGPISTNGRRQSGASNGGAQ